MNDRVFSRLPSTFLALSLLLTTTGALKAAPEDVLSHAPPAPTSAPKSVNVRPIVVAPQPALSPETSSAKTVPLQTLIQQPGEPPVHLRRLKGAEVPVPLRAELHGLLRKNRDKKIGDLVPTTFEGRTYIARIESHYHPEGGPVKPWGYHRGVSLFVER